MTEKISKLIEISQHIRQDIITMIYQAGDGHPGPSLSCADIVTALYFEIMKIDPANPNWPERDRFSKTKKIE